MYCVLSFKDQRLTTFPGKATDENLTSENWEYILVSCVVGRLKKLCLTRTQDVCDKVAASESGCEHALPNVTRDISNEG